MLVVVASTGPASAIVTVFVKPSAEVVTICWGSWWPLVSVSVMVSTVFPSEVNVVTSVFVSSIAPSPFVSSVVVFDRLIERRGLDLLV